jgi:hypothetical protein
MRLDDLFPRNYNIEKNLQSQYNSIKDGTSFLKGSEHAEIFLFAMAIGLRRGMRKKLETPYPLVVCTGFGPKDRAMIVSVALKEKGQEVLADRNEIRKIAEEYANAGIDEVIELANIMPSEAAIAIVEEDIMNATKGLKPEENLERGSSGDDVH